MTTTSKPWYVADPIYQIVEFGENDRCVRGLVATPAFQRLRRISQLGLASFVFPGAVHTRFSHCIGAAHLASLVCEVLGKEVSQHAGSIVCAALLHDIGHGPFSHSFERALERILNKRLKHEEWTRKIVCERLSGVLEKAKIDPLQVAEMIKSSGKTSVPSHVKEIISSQLDVDRMDYLCRDAHFTGVTVGKIDVQYLVRCLRIIQHGSQQTLGLTAKGVPCYEAFAFARHVMNRTVYFHKQVATFECMMEECLRLLVDDDTDKYLPEFFRKLRELPVSARAQGLDLDSFLDSYLAMTEDQIWTSLGERVAGTSRLSKLAQRLLHRQPVTSFKVAAGKYAILKGELEQGGFAQDQYRIRTLPSSLYEQDSDEQVFVKDESTKLATHISEESSLVDSLRDHTEIEAILVIFDENAQAKIEDAARQANCLTSGPQRRSSPPSGGPSVAKATSGGPPLETEESTVSRVTSR